MVIETFEKRIRFNGALRNGPSNWASDSTMLVKVLCHHGSGCAFEVTVCRDVFSSFSDFRTWAIRKGTCQIRICFANWKYYLYYSYAETQQILFKKSKSIRFKFEAIDGVMMMGEFL